MKSVEAVKNINLEIKDGEIFGFIGPNGAGKSTTIKMILGLLRCSSGSISINGHAPGSLEAKKILGYLPEHPYFYDYLSGYELIRFYGKLSGLNGAELDKKIEIALRRVHANKDWIYKSLRRYSKGMVQRVGMAQAILHDPKILLLDEPMSGLDPVGRRDVRNVILDLNKKGTTIFYSSHVLSDVEKISDRVAIIINGHINQCGSIEEIVHPEEIEYKIALDVQNENILSEAPFWGTFRNGHFYCKSKTDRDSLIHWALDKKLTVETIEYSRPSLEDILTKEIALHE